MPAADATDVDATTVEHRLRRLGGADRLAFVADLWAARGFETRRDGTLVVATRGGESLTIHVPERRRLGTPDPPARPVDVVVAPRGGSGPARIAADHDARLLVAADLREMLQYAVSRATAAALCERHLGGPPAALRPPLATRVRSRARTVASLTSPGTLLAVLLVVVGLGGATGVAVTLAPAGGDGAALLGAMGGAAEPNATAGRERDPYPPGVGPTGVENLSALAAAHERTLRGLSYTVWADRYRPRGGVPNATRVQLDVDVVVDGDRYVARTTAETEAESTPVREVYGDRRGRYVATFGPNGTSYRRALAGEPAPPVTVDPVELRRTLVTRYLDTSERSVERVERDGRTRFRIEARGRPSAPDLAGVEGYTAVALVDRRGLVRELAVEYAVATPTGSYPVRFEVTYDRFGRTTVTPPAWFDEAFRAAGTADAASGFRSPD